MPSDIIAPLAASPKRETLVFRVLVQKPRIRAHGPVRTTVAIAVTSPPALDRSTMHAH